MKRKSMEDAIDELKNNLETVARVSEWAELMGYENPKLFSRHFLLHFGRSPEKVMKEVRLESIIAMLRTNNKLCREVAWAHSMLDEKALNNYTKRHLDLSPSQLKESSDKELGKLMENLGSKFGE